MDNMRWRRAGIKAAVVVIIMLALLVLLVPAASSQTLGDVNFDGSVNILDVVIVQRYILGLQTLTPTQVAAADVNRDGLVNVVDVNLMMQYIQGYISSFPTHHLHASVLISPLEGASVEGSAVSFQWGAVTGATKYQLEIIRVSNGTLFRTVDLGNITSTTVDNFSSDGTQYRWRIRAGNNTGWGAWSLHRTFTNGGSILPAPTLSSPANNSALTGTSVLFRWNAVNGATKYQLEVYRGTETVPFKDVTVGNLTMSEQFGFLRDGTQYRWRVRAGNNVGWGAWSGYFNLISGSVPAAPVLSSPANNASVPGFQISFQWNAVTGANKYELEVVDKSNSAFIVKAILGDVTSSQQRGFPNDASSYKWRVRAGSTEGWGAWSDYAHFVNGSAPGTPVLLRPEQNENIGRSWFNFEWQAVAGADRYELEIKDSAGSVFRTATIYGRTTSLQQDFPVDGGQYTWKVRAGNANGWSSVWSAARSFTVGSPFGFPTLLAPAANSTQRDARITFSWQALDNASRYNLEIIDVRTGQTRTNIIVEDPSSVQRNFPVDGSEYKWRVRAGDANRWGSWSAFRHFISDIAIASASPSIFASPTLLSPAAGATAATESIEFSWTAVTGAARYQIQVVRVADGQVVFDRERGSRSLTQGGFPNDGTEYLWRVRAIDGDGLFGPWSLYGSFINGAFWWNISF